MSCYALYRLPYADSYTLVEQQGDAPLRLRSCSELNGVEGFVVAPFQVTDVQPIWVIQGPAVTRSIASEAQADDSPAGERLLSDTMHRVPTGNARLLSDTMHRVPTGNYAIDFANFHAQLLAGTFRKIVLSRCAEEQRTTFLDPRKLFLQACRLYPRMFIALACLPDGTCWLSATPEILLEGVGGEWRTIALAGTMQLQGDELQGEGETVRWSTKNIQEQRYVATYIAECLERFSLDFREEGPRTVRAANLVHLRSDFTFLLNDAERVGDLLQELHPTPAVCGLPKREAFGFIVRHEHTPRQYYSGFMGPLEMNAGTHLYVSLRCMQMTETKYRLYAGGGLLKESRMELEWQETEAKMQPMRQLLNSLTLEHRV